MKTSKKSIGFLFFSSLIMFGLFLYGCQESPVTSVEQSDDEYLQTTAIQSAFNSDPDDEDNLMFTEVSDFESEGAVEDYPGAPQMDSIYRWGQIITNVSINTSISDLGDTAKQVEVTRTVTGELIILYFGSGSGGTLDTARKPFTREQKRFVTFKRVSNNPNPRFRWRVYSLSAVDGQTTSPMTGKNNIVINSVQIYKNGTLEMELTGPDFTVNTFLSRLYGGEGLLKLHPGDNVNVKVNLSSNQADKDIVLFHWPGNSFGFHRVRFEMTSETPNGTGWNRVFERDFQIFNPHGLGVFNGYISASIRSSLFDADPSKFSSTYMGMRYRIRNF